MGEIVWRYAIVDKPFKIGYCRFEAGEHVRVNAFQLGVLVDRLNWQRPMLSIYNEAVAAASVLENLRWADGSH